jgi:hypothetical protein
MCTWVSMMLPPALSSFWEQILLCQKLYVDPTLVSCSSSLSLYLLLHHAGLWQMAEIGYRFLAPGKSLFWCHGWAACHYTLIWVIHWPIPLPCSESPELMHRAPPSSQMLCQTTLNLLSYIVLSIYWLVVVVGVVVVVVVVVVNLCHLQPPCMMQRLVYWQAAWPWHQGGTQESSAICNHPTVVWGA